MRWRGLAAAIQLGADYSATGVLSGRSTGGGKTSLECQFPGAPHTRLGVPVSRPADMRGSC